MEQRKNEERQQRHSEGSAAKEMSRHHEEGARTAMNRDKRDVQKQDHRDSANNPNQSNSMSRQGSQEKQD